jgi:hypothetical protein
MTPTEVIASFLRAGIGNWLEGPPGCGKTKREHAASKLAGMRTVVIRGAKQDRVDFSGTIVPDIEYHVSRSLPLDLLSDLQSTLIPTHVIFDDFGQMPIDVQGAVMGLFDENSNPNVVISGTTNGIAHKSGVVGVIEPFRTRIVSAFRLPSPADDVSAAPLANELGSSPPLLCTWVQEVTGWLDWAQAHGCPPEIAAWHRATRGRTLYLWQPHASIAQRFPDYRSWEGVIKAWRAGIRDRYRLSAILGQSVASELCQFIALKDTVVTPDQIRSDPGGARVPDASEVNALFMITELMIADARPSDASAYATYLARLPRVYSALATRTLCEQHKDERVRVRFASDPTWLAWSRDNQDLWLAA